MKLRPARIPRSILKVAPGEGELLQLGSIGAHFKVGRADTDGQYSIVEHPLAPGALVPPHRHSREDELMYVLEGEIGARVGGEILHAAKGSYVFKPRNVAHTFWNERDEPALVMHILSPGGFEQYFTDLHQLMPKGGQPDFERVTRLAASYGVKFQLDWVPELEKRFGVSVYGRGSLTAGTITRKKKVKR